MNSIFKVSKQKPIIKVKGYTYLGAHSIQPGIHYYIRPFDNKGNYDFLEARIGYDFNNKFKRKIVFEAGTNIKVIDSFMTYYLKELKNSNFKSNKTFIKNAMLFANIYSKDYYKLFSCEVPKEFKQMQEYKTIIKQGYTPLYCLSSNPETTKIDRHTIVFVRETHEELIDSKIEYVSFKTLELLTKMDYLNKGSGIKYNVLGTGDIAIPYDILK